MARAGAVHPSRLAQERERLRMTGRGQRLLNAPTAKSPLPSHNVKQPIFLRTCTTHLVPAARLRPGREIKSPPRGVGGAPTGARVQRHPSGLPRQRRVNASHAAGQALKRSALRPMTRDARLSALRRGDFWPGAALPSAELSSATRAASSSQPGRSAWRAVPRASRVSLRLRAAVAGRHTLLRLWTVSGRRPSMSKTCNSSP